jgi:hypothetical protein
MSDVLTDQIQTFPNIPGYDYKVADMSVTVDFAVLVYSGDYYGVRSNQDSSTLVNDGYIFSVFRSGVYFNGGGDVIVNNADGTIRGNLGIDVDGISGETITNHGKVVGFASGVLFDFHSEHVVLANDGDIYGGEVGIQAASLSDGGVISNSANIRSGLDGIFVNTAPGLVTVIDNHGTISGTDASIKTFGGGAISVTNHGTLNGAILCQAPSANDSIVNRGTINGSVALGPGNELFDGKGGTSGPIFCGSGNDRVIAGKDKVAIHVGNGNSTLTGGPGHDQLIFDSALSGHVEKFTNFNVNRDKIELSAADFAGIGPIGHVLAAADFHVGAHATAHSQHIIYNPGNGFLYHDPDGSGPITAIHFATLSPHLALTHSDFLVTA